MSIFRLYCLFILCCFSEQMDGQSEWIIQLKEGYQEEQLNTGWSKTVYRNNQTFKVRSIGPHFRIYSLKASEAMTKAELMKNPAIAFAEIDRPLEIRSKPNDPLLSKQWHFDKIAAPKAWNSVTGGVTFNNDSIVIGVIDNGFRITHEDLKNRIWRNQAEIPGNRLDDDGNGYKDDTWGLSLQYLDERHRLDTFKNHGTSVLGVIGGESNNSKGISGVMWSTKLMLGSMTDQSLVSELIELFNYMLEQRLRYNQSGGKEGAYVVAINYSGGLPYAFAKDYPIWCGMYDAMGKAGIVNCAATINEPVNVDEEGDMPTTCTSEFMITITSTDRDDQKVTRAGYGLKHIDLGAPGNFFETTHSGSDQSYISFDGTSAATPVVAGAVGLLYSYPCKEWADYQKQNPSSAVLLAKRAILAGVDKNDNLIDKTLSGGRLNIARSLDSLKKWICSKGGADQIILKTIYPNPTRESLNLILESSADQPFRLEIFDVAGRKIYNLERVNIRPYYKLDLPTLATGVYILKLTQDKIQSSNRFVIRN